MVEVFHSVPNGTDGPKRELRGNSSAVVKPNMHNIPIKHTIVIPTNIDHIPSNTTNSGSSAMLCVFEDNQAVIKMIIKGRSPTMRHVSRTQRFALDWLFDRINLDPQIQILYIDTKHQLADMLTKGNFTRDEWNNLLSGQYQPFQLHLLHQEFQLGKLLHNGEEYSKSKRRRSCVQVATSNDEYVFFIATSSSAASSPIASKSPGMPIASGKPDSMMSVEPSSFDAASTSQVRLKDAYFGGLTEEQR